MPPRDLQNEFELRGPGYLAVLEALHESLRPKSYLEIGTLAGGTLKLARCASVAIDPQFRVHEDVIGQKEALHLFQQTSDDFFRSRDVSAILGAPIDLVFIDGMHLFEFVLRDFINSERMCRHESVIAIHDCLPPDPYMAVRSTSDPDRQRSRSPESWTGDVWKIVPILRHYRPDLRTYVLDSRPTGLMLITDLNPTSALLTQHYDAIVKAYSELTLDEYPIHKFWSECEIVAATISFEYLAG